MTLHAKIQKWGNRLALRISGAIREIPRLKEGTEVDIEVTEDGFTITKSKMISFGWTLNLQKERKLVNIVQY